MTATAETTIVERCVDHTDWLLYFSAFFVAVLPLHHNGTDSVPIASFAHVLSGKDDDVATVPTLVKKDKSHAAPMRLDYILASKAYMEKYPSRVRVLKEDRELDTLSDHYPVEIGC